MARKPIAKVGQQVIVEDIDNPLQVLEIAMLSLVPKSAGFTDQFIRKARGHDLYAYRCKMARGKPRWFLGSEIIYVVEYTPLVMEISRHVEIIQELSGYEMLSDFLHSLPHSKKHNHQIADLIRLVEQCALSIEGDSDERYDANNAIESIMR